MTLQIRHAFESTVTEGSDPTKVRTSNWNEDHVSDAAEGSMFYVGAGGALVAIDPATSNGKVLTWVSGVPAWADPTGGGGGGTGPYRWLRIYIVSNGGDQYTGLGEVEVHSTVGGSDVTTSSTPCFANSSYVVTPPPGAVDGDYDQPWINNGDGSITWLALDLGTPTAVAEVLLMPQSNESGSRVNTRSPTAFAIQGSNMAVSDARFITDWQTYATFTSVSGWTRYAFQTFTV